MINRVILVPAEVEFMIEESETILDIALRQHISLNYSCEK